MRQRTIAFTGHRPQHLGGFRPNHLHTACRNFLALAVKQAVECGGYTHFISGGALGVDQWAARIVLDYAMCGPVCTVKLTIARPFPSQDCKWPEESPPSLSGVASRRGRGCGR